MNLRFKQIIPVLFLVLTVFSLFAASVNAQTPTPTSSPSPTASATSMSNVDTSSCNFFTFSFFSCVNSVLATIVNNALDAMGVLLAFTGGLLNVSIVITMHIKDFVSATPAIYSIWQTIRDVTGIFFIFFLLYAAFQIILGLGNNYGKMIVTIVTAGILINFSFFIVSVLIDASNVVSLALFNSMVPTSVTVDRSTTVADIAVATGMIQSTGSNINPGTGISQIFMNSLKIQSNFNTSKNGVGSKIGDPFTIIVVGIVGIIIMITAAFSFLLAAAAFIARLVILLFLLAFSPIWFAGMIIPQLKDKMGEFKKQLEAQLVFMPVYLLLMYAALKVLNESNIMGAASSSISNMPTGTNWAFSYMVLAINFAMVIVMLNLPLIVGLKLGGAATGWMDKTMARFNAASIWKRVGSEAKMGSYGRVASMIGRSEHLQNFAANWKVGEMALKGVRSVASDYNKKTDEQIKKKGEFAESLGYNQRDMNAAQLRLRTAQRELSSAKVRGLTGTALDPYEATVGAAKGGIAEVENSRKMAYGKRVESPTAGFIGSSDNLLLKMSRRDKLAAAKIQIPVLEKHLAGRKKSLEETQADIKQLAANIRNNPSGVGTVDVPGVIGFKATKTQADEMTRLQGEEVKKLGDPANPKYQEGNTVNDLERRIDDLKLRK